MPFSRSRVEPEGRVRRGAAVPHSLQHPQLVGHHRVGEAVEPAPPHLLLVLFFLGASVLILSVWSIVAFLNGLALANGFSRKRAFASFLIPTAAILGVLFFAGWGYRALQAAQ